AVGYHEHRVPNTRVLGADDQPARQKQRLPPWRGGARTAFYLYVGAAQVGIGRADGLPQQWRQRDPPLEAVNAKMHEMVVDLHALDVNAVRDRAARVDDVEPHAGKLVGHETDDEFQPALGEGGVVDGARRHGHRQQDQEAGDAEEEAAHGLKLQAYSFGEKLMCRRGLVLRDSGCATSIPKVTTGRRTRNPMPTEYSSGTPSIS